jgi:hydrogenase maturation factor
LNVRSGKLPPELLERLLSRLTGGDPRVRVGPRLGEDAAAIDVERGTLIVTTDPVTFTSIDAAWYAVQVNANDVAAMGAEPAWLALTALLPPKTEAGELERLFERIASACAELGICVVTGHTEVTRAVNQPVLIGTMIGLTERGAEVTSAGARPGDALILAGPIAVEGTAILAHEAARALQRAGVEPPVLAAAREFLRDPGISVVQAARTIRAICRPHALHDATEGGVATALREVAAASGVALELDAPAMPLRPETRRICAALAIDPLGLVASGCLVAAVDDHDVAACLRALAQSGVEAARAGSVVAGRDVWLGPAAAGHSLPSFERDELARYFDDVRANAGRGRARSSRSSASQP